MLSCDIGVIKRYVMMMVKRQHASVERGLDWTLWALGFNFGPALHL